MKETKGAWDGTNCNGYTYAVKQHSIVKSYTLFKPNNQRAFFQM